MADRAITEASLRALLEAIIERERMTAIGRKFDTVLADCHGAQRIARELLAHLNDARPRALTLVETNNADCLIPRE
jgi:hypothetical protein